MSLEDKKAIPVAKNALVRKAARAKKPATAKGAAIAATRKKSAAKKTTAVKKIAPVKKKLSIVEVGPVVGINSLSTVYIGNLSSTPGVSIGVGGALAVDSTTSPPSVTAQGSLSNGTNPLMCGNLTCSSISASGSVSVGTGAVILASAGSATAPSYSFGGDTGTGLYRSAAGSTAFASGGVQAAQVSSTRFDTFVPISTNGSPISSGSLPVGTGAVILADTGSVTAPSYSFGGDTGTGLYRSAAGSTAFASGGVQAVRMSSTRFDTFVPIFTNGSSISSGSITAAGPISSGAFGMTCAGLSCTSVASTGDVTQPRYYLRAYMAANQAVTNVTNTLVVYDTIETTGGGNSGFVAVPPIGRFTIPVAGMYTVTFEIQFDVSATGIRNLWAEVNNAGVGGVRRYSTTTFSGVAGSSIGAIGAFQRRFAAGDTVQTCCYQSSGASLNLIGGGASGVIFTAIQIVRDFE